MPLEHQLGARVIHEELAVAGEDLTRVIPQRKPVVVEEDILQFEDRRDLGFRLHLGRSHDFGRRFRLHRRRHDRRLGLTGTPGAHGKKRNQG